MTAIARRLVHSALGLSLLVLPLTVGSNLAHACKGEDCPHHAKGKCTECEGAAKADVKSGKKAHKCGKTECGKVNCTEKDCSKHSPHESADKL